MNRIGRYISSFPWDLSSRFVLWRGLFHVAEKLMVILGNSGGMTETDEIGNVKIIDRDLSLNTVDSNSPVPSFKANLRSGRLKPSKHLLDFLKICQNYWGPTAIGSVQMPDIREGSSCVEESFFLVHRCDQEHGPAGPDQMSSTGTLLILLTGDMHTADTISYQMAPMSGVEWVYFQFHEEPVRPCDQKLRFA